MMMQPPMQQGPIRVLMLEDHLLVRESLAALLESAGILVTGQFSHAQPFLAAATRGAGDVALVDIALDGATEVGPEGLAVLSALQSTEPPVRPVVVSAFRTAALVDQAYHLGAFAYLYKLDTSRDTLVEAIRAAYRGERVADANAFQAAFNVQRLTPEPQQQASPLSTLTDRERDVLACVAAGADNLKIAAMLGITERTVRAHVSSLYKKLGRENRADLALYARDLGIRPRTR
jgi:DNA-binding NarL/FixJ family response regulator